MTLPQIREAVSREAGALESLLSSFERAQRTFIGQAADFLAQTRPEELDAVASRAQEAVSLNIAMQAPALNAEEQGLVHSGILLAQRLQERRTRRSEAWKQLLEASALELLESLASGNVTQAAEIDAEFSAVEGCRGALEERITDASSLLYPLVHSPLRRASLAGQGDRLRRASGRVRPAAQRPRDDVLDYCFSSDGVLLVMAYLSGLQQRSTNPTLRRFLQRLIRELQMHKDVVGNWLLLDKPAYRALILVLDCLQAPGGPGEAVEAVRLVAAAARAVDDVPLLRKALSDPELACLQTIPWYRRQVLAGLEQLCSAVDGRELRLYAGRLLFVSCKWDRSGLGDFLVEETRRELEGILGSGRGSVEPFSRASCLLFRDCAGSFASSGGARVLHFQRLVEHAREIMSPFLLEDLPGGAGERGAFGECVAEAVSSHCAQLCEAVCAEFVSSSFGSGEQGAPGASAVSSASQKPRTGLSPAGEGAPPVSSARGVTRAMESLILLAAQQQVVSEYYKLDSDDVARSALAASADALRDSLACMGRLVLSTRIGGVSAFSARCRGMTPALRDDRNDGSSACVSPGTSVAGAACALRLAGPAAVSSNPERLAHLVDQVLMWQEIRMLGVFPLEAEHVFSGALLSLEVFLRDEFRGLISRVFDSSPSKSSQRRAQAGAPRASICPTVSSVCSLAQAVYDVVASATALQLDHSRRAGAGGALQAGGLGIAERKVSAGLANALCHSIAEAVVAGVIRQGPVGEKAAESVAQECVRPAIDLLSRFSSRRLQEFTEETATLMRQCRYSRDYAVTLQNLGLSDLVPVLSFCRVSAVDEIYGARDFSALCAQCSQFRAHTVFPGLCVLDVLSPGEFSGLVKNVFERRFSKGPRDKEEFYARVSALKSLNPLDRDDGPVRGFLVAGPGGDAGGCTPVFP